MKITKKELNRIIESKVTKIINEALTPDNAEYIKQLQAGLDMMEDINTTSVRSGNNRFLKKELNSVYQIVKKSKENLRKEITKVEKNN